MEVRFIDRSQQLTDAHRDSGERSLRFAMSRFGDEVRHITVTTHELNGPKGGIDKRCVIRAKLRRRGTVEVMQDARDFSACLTLAAGRLGRSVRRQLDRRKDFDRRTVRRDGFLPTGTAGLS